MDSLNKKSTALGGLYDWTVNIMKYQEKIEQVVPLKREASGAKQKADEMQAMLDKELKEY